MDEFKIKIWILNSTLTEMASLILTLPKMISCPDERNHAEWINLEEPTTQVLLDTRPFFPMSNRKFNSFVRQYFVLSVLFDN